MNEQQIESLLRKAPDIRAPRELRERLEAGIELAPGFTRRAELTPLSARGFRRWIPALGFALWFLTCVVVLGVQAGRIAELKERNRALEATSHQADEAVTPADATPVPDAAVGAFSKEQEEIKRLRAEVAELRALLAELPVLNDQNAKLRAEIAARRAATPPAAAQQDFFVVQQERAATTRCINNLKQIGLAAALWANSAKLDRWPSDFEGIKQELKGQDRVLLCPGDGASSYTLLSPAASRNRPEVVFVRCPVHNNVVLVDGSAHILGTDRRVVQRDGVWVIER